MLSHTVLVVGSKLSPLTLAPGCRLESVMLILKTFGIAARSRMANRINNCQLSQRSLSPCSAVTCITQQQPVCVCVRSVAPSRHRPHTVREPQVREMSRLQCVLGPVVADHQKGIMQFQWPAGSPRGWQLGGRARNKLLRPRKSSGGRKARAAKKCLSERWKEK